MAAVEYGVGRSLHLDELAENVSRVKIRRWITRLVGVAVLLLSICGIAFLVSAQLLSQHNDAEQLFLENRGGGGPPDTRQVRPRFKVFVNSGDVDSTVLLVFTVDDFSPRDGEVRGTVAALIDEDSYRRQFPQSALPISLELSLYSLFSVTVIDVPLTSYDPRLGYQSPKTVGISLEAWGDAQSFPDDSYAVPYLIGMPSGFGYPDVSLLIGSRLNSYTVHESINSAYFNLLIQRRALQRLWVYLLVFSPVALIAALSLILFRRHPEASSFALQAAVGIFALLPLRQVLVPADADTLTRVDLFLGVEFLIFMIIAAAGLFYLQKGGPRAAGRGGGPSNAPSSTRQHPLGRSAIIRNRLENFAAVIVFFALITWSIVRSVRFRKGKYY